MGCGASSARIAAKYSSEDDPLTDRSIIDAPYYPSYPSAGSVQSASSLLGIRRSLKNWESTGFVRCWTSTRPAPGNEQRKLVNDGRIQDNYDVQKWSEKIGKGASGSVFRARHKVSGNEAAVKKCFKVRSDDALAFKREALLVNSIDHPNCVSIREVFEDRRCVYFVFELCAGGELLKKLMESDSFSEEDCTHVMWHVLRGVSYIHDRRICHRDLKPDNFLLLEEAQPLRTSTIKIIDFGSASHIEQDRCLTTFTGTPAYIAPEVYSRSYHLGCDIWSCGVIVYLLLSGELPFGADKLDALKCQVICGEYSFDKPQWIELTSESKDFVKQCLAVDPRQRWKASDALRHDWLNDNARRSRGNSEICVLRNLANYWNASKQKLAAVDIVSQHMSSTSCSRLEEAFLSKDKNKTGQLSYAEVTSILQQSGLNLPVEHISELVKSWDTDISGVIDYHHFAAGINQSHAEVEEEICMAAFRHIDRNGDGVLTLGELEENCSELRGIMSSEAAVKVLDDGALDRVMEIADTDGDGVINFDEFMILVAGRRASTYLQWSDDMLSSVSVVQAMT